MLDAEVQRLLALGIAEKSHTTYKAGWSKFLEFGAEYGVDVNLPISVGNLTYFVAFLSKNKFAKSSITTYLAAIAFKHKIHGFQDPSDSFIIKKMVNGLRRDQGEASDLRLPITIDLLARLVSALPAICTTQWEVRLFNAVFLVTFFGFLRIGEVCANSRSVVQPATLQRSDISFKLVEGVRVVLINFRVSKNNQFGGNQTIVLRPHPNQRLCAVSALMTYLQQSQGNGVLFSHFDSSPLTRYQFTNVLARAVDFCDFPNKTLFKSHSFRIGAATTARQNGIPDSEIQTMGRWRSGAFKTYIRLPPLLAG